MQPFLTLYVRYVPQTMSLVAKASQFVVRGRRKGGTERADESPYVGRAWTDTAERELTESIATYRNCRY